MTAKRRPRSPLIDVLIDRTIAESRTEGISLILAGKVIVDDQRIDKPNIRIPTDASIRIRGHRPFVSRGGEKLAGAIAELDLAKEFYGTTVLDIGASTGGFTDCVLKLGAEKVIAVDVGTNQLAWKLRNHPKVISMEKTDIRDVQPADLPALDWIVADISFNSLSRLATAIARLGRPNHTRYLLLVKPQFELATIEVPAGGVVRDDALRHRAVAMVTATFAQLGLAIRNSVDSCISGRAGNQEIFVYVAPDCPK